jgi:outer membrane lipoprotein-sorting protein
MFLESKETLGTLTISHEPNGDISISKSPTDTAYANAKKALVSQNTFDQTFATMTLADFKIHFNHVFNNMKLDDDKFDITVPNMEVTGMFLRKGGSSLDRNQFSVLFSPGNNPLGRLTFVKK